MHIESILTRDCDIEHFVQRRNQELGGIRAGTRRGNRHQRVFPDFMLQTAGQGRDFICYSREQVEAGRSIAAKQMAHFRLELRRQEIQPKIRSADIVNLR